MRPTFRLTTVAVRYASMLWLAMQTALAQPSGIQPGAIVPNFTLKTIDGEPYSLYAQKGKKGFVIAFISTQCPVSNAYNARFIKLAEMAKQGMIEWIAINPNETEPIDEVRLHAREKGFPFPVLKDEGNRVTDLLGAKYTPEVFLLDANFRLLYRGRIDDNQREERVVSKDLEEAIAAYLAGVPIPNPVTTARGCVIKRSS